MKAKLTLTIDKSVIDAGKVYAKKNERSLSVIVENYLKSLTIPEGPAVILSPKVTRLMGVIKLPADFEYKKYLNKALTRRYLKS